MKTVIAGALVSLLAFTSGTGAVAPVSAPGQASPALDILDRYAAGDYGGAVHAIEALDRLDATFDAIRLAAPAWIHHKGSPDRRRLIVATVAVEIAHARRDVSWRLRWPFIVWACELVRSNATHWAAERWWYLASVATMEEAGDWADLAGIPKGSVSLPARRFFSPADQEEYRVGHLEHAKTAFTGEPRFLLAEAVAREHSSLFGSTTGPPPHGIGAEEVSDTLVSNLSRRAGGERVDAVADISSDSARRILARIAAIPAIAQDFASLGRYSAIRGEVELHLGFLAARSRDWNGALAHLGAVPTLTTEPMLICLSHYFSGWVLQRRGDRGDAIGAYRLALDAAPHARSLSILLAAQLAEDGQHGEAYRTMGDALEAGRSVVDPWTAFGLGDARLLPEFLEHLREALK